MSVKQFVLDSYPQAADFFTRSSQVSHDDNPNLQLRDRCLPKGGAIPIQPLRDEIMSRWGKNYLYLRSHIRDVMESNDLQVATTYEESFEKELFLIVMETLFESDITIGFVGLTEEATTQYIFALLRERGFIEAII
jgi:hypothetical protein